MCTQTIAKKYAHAFMRLHPPQEHATTWHSLALLRKFLDRNPRFCARLASLATPYSKKKEHIETIYRTLSLPQQFFDLCMLLLAHQRIAQLPHVVHHLLEEYQHQINDYEVLLTTSHELDASAYKTLASYAQLLVGARTMKLTHCIDQNLICGVRIATKHMVWEKSVAQSLAATEQEIRRRIQE